jgi:hypothetical protein
VAVVVMIVVIVVVAAAVVVVMVISRDNVSHFSPLCDKTDPKPITVFKIN